MIEIKLSIHYRAEWGQTLAVCGAPHELGAWNEANAFPLTCIDGYNWQATIQINTEALLPLKHHTYYYLLRDAEGMVIRREWRPLHRLVEQAGEVVDCWINYPTDERTLVHNHLGAGGRATGVAVPLFSIRGDSDWGCGDFGTLNHLIEQWCSPIGIKLIQLLPINDTTFYRDWRDSYPYNAISAHAIHHIYICLNTLKPLSDGIPIDIDNGLQSLRHTPDLDYPSVAKLKEQYLRLHFAEHGDEVMQTQGYKSFLKDNHYWLEPYSIFCTLRDQHPMQTFHQWGVADKSKISETPIDRYYLYIQYLAHEQLSQVAHTARSLGITLKGDLPIGVAPHSVEAWLSPELFHTDRSAGAPPDAFAMDGQNWGFPTYNWEAMQADGFRWWRGRLEHLSQYFDAMRIDHILGFFRIWSIPRYQYSGLLGHFSPSQPKPISYWTDILGFDSPELLISPIIHQDDTQDLTETQRTALVPVEGTPFLRLPHGRQADYTDEVLQELCKEVAFVQDMDHPDLYHPRIALEQTKLYNRWSNELQAKWRALSNDYYHRLHNELWRRAALDRLRPLLSASDILLCAEDLGMIPATVPTVLDELGILSLELERMPKGFVPSGWADLSKLPYRAVCTTSTHDMPSLRGWWHSLDETAKTSYLSERGSGSPLSVNSPEEEIYRSIIERHLASPCALVVLPLQDWLSISPKLTEGYSPDGEQINHPENPNQKWAWRYPHVLRSQMVDELRSLITKHKR